jgi:beta-lactamase regulating signal transducer with metallopeptidase domain
MHPLLTSTALGLIAAWPVGALGLGLGRLVERLTEDPRPRAAAWSLAYALPAGALAATIALTFAPASLQPAAPTAAIVPGPVRMAVVEMTTDARQAPAAAAWSPSPVVTNGLAWSLVGLSAAGLLARGWRWNRGRRRLAQVRAAAEPSQDYALTEAVRLRAARLGVKAPRVRISAAVGEPLLAGARRPVILLPKALAESADTRRLELVCGHELAHLRRGDNWRIPAEEALAGLFWLVPPVKALRGRMLAAREAVCDLTALDGAAPEARRDYARVLVEALKMNATPSPQSAFGAAFTGRDRNLAALRLSAILQPQGRASGLRVGLVLVLGGAMTAATGAGSLALAAQARRLAPSPETVSAAEAASAIAAEDAAPAAEAAPALEAAPASAAAPAAEAAPARDSVAAAAPPAPLAPIAALAPMRVRLGPNPNPRPDPRPDPHPDPRPNPQPNPQPNPRPQSKLTGIEFQAEVQESSLKEDKVVFIGDVEVRGRIDPVNVVVKVNGVQASPWFQPADLRAGVIQRVEVTNARPGSGTPVLNITLK